MKSISPFDVFNRMLETDDKKLEMAPLNNILSANVVKAGTKITIGVSGNRVSAILNGEIVGGLILCDKKRYLEVKYELERGEDTHGSAV